MVTPARTTREHARSWVIHKVGCCSCLFGRLAGVPEYYRAHYGMYFG